MIQDVYPQQQNPTQQAKGDLSTAGDWFALIIGWFVVIVALGVLLLLLTKA